MVGFFFCRSKILPFKTKYLDFNYVIPCLQVLNVLYIMRSVLVMVLLSLGRREIQMGRTNPSLFSSILESSCRAGSRTPAEGWWATPQPLPADCSSGSFGRPPLDHGDKGPLEEVVKFVGREMLIEGDPREKPCTQNLGGCKR